MPQIVKKVAPSIIMIFTYDREGKSIGQGSGFFISTDGDIITSRHVLLGAYLAEVKTADGKIFPVSVIKAEDKEADIVRASVKVPRTVTALSLNTSIPEVGEKILVIGSPLGLEQSVSDGIVSAVREVPQFGKVLQITAPISPNSSGSPVVNMKGEVIGVATFQVTEGQNLNFAIPSERISKLKIEKGKTLEEWNKGTPREWFTSAEGLYARGLPFLFEENYEKALDYFQKTVEKKPDYADAYFQIGYCLDELGRYPEAVKAYKQAIRIKRDYAEAHYNLGVVYDKLGRYLEAVKAYKQAIRIKPDFAEAHYNLGGVYDELGRYPEAVEACKQAIRIKPDFAGAHYNLGTVYGKLGRYPEAVEALKQAIRIKPDFAEAHYNLGGVYDELGRYPEAVEPFKQTIRIKPDFAEAHFLLGIVYDKLGRYPEAVEAFKQAIRIEPDFAEAHYALGVTYLLLGDRSSALEEYKILKDLNKDLANKL
ncbi:MAG: tetratricopeptide repeat protein [bacterium JZ-2024 1]